MSEVEMLEIEALGFLSCDELRVLERIEAGSGAVDSFVDILDWIDPR